jgi:L-seryl-tRNA(Ser) seleniumtransferase
VVKPLGIPVLVDAASEHLENPSPWLVRGADLVIYSGGKFLRGPQTSGLLLGRKDLVQAAWRNASPHQALGRPMKVSKEDIVGLVTAVEYWFRHRDVAAERRRWQADLDLIAAKVGGIGTTTLIAPEGVERVPRLRVSWDAARTGLDGNALRAKLLNGSPRIMLDDMSAGANSITIEPFGLQAGEAAQVGDAIAVALSANAAADGPAAPLQATLAGEWDLVVKFLHGERAHRLSIGQRGAAIEGSHESAEFAGPVTGQLTPDGVAFHFDTRYEGSVIRFSFDGRLAPDRMTGTVSFGTYNDHHMGIVNLAQFGAGAFRATRTA